MIRTMSFALAVAALLSVAGCRATFRPRRPAVEVDVQPVPIQIAVRTAPPVARVEIKPPVPGLAALYYWTPGHWKWNGRKYVWVKGHWGKRGKEHRGKVWVPGHRKNARHGHRWVPGHWR